MSLIGPLHNYFSRHTFLTYVFQKGLLSIIIVNFCRPRSNLRFTIFKQNDLTRFHWDDDLELILELKKSDTLDQNWSINLRSDCWDWRGFYTFSFNDEFLDWETRESDYWLSFCLDSNFIVVASLFDGQRHPIFIDL